MSKTTDWLPTGRKKQITMAKNWLSILNEETGGKEGGRVRKYAAWGIPAAAVTELAAFLGEAERCLAAAENEETRAKSLRLLALEFAVIPQTPYRYSWSFAIGKTPKLSGIAG